jgi:phytoene desaturase
LAATTVSIVGGGLAGLAAGVALARRGMQVQVFEANAKAGGCSATSTERGFTFHDGALFLTMPGLLDAAFARIGLDRAREVPLRRMDRPYAAFLPGGVTAEVQGRSVWVARDGRPAQVAAEADLERLAARWRPVMRLFFGDLMLQPLSARRMVTHGWRYVPRLRGTVGAELRRAIRDEAVQAALGGLVLYAGLASDALPIPSVMGIVALLDEGFFLPEGGMGRIPEALARAFASAGGELHLGSRVERIVVEAGRARGVEVAGVGHVPSDIVLSTASGMLTFGSLVDAQHISGALRRKVRSARLSHKAVGIQLGLANRIPAPAHVNCVLPALAEQGRVFDPAQADRWLSFMVSTVTQPDLAAGGGSIVELFCPVDPSVPLDPDGVERVADRAIAALASRYPLDIVVRRVRGPQQFRADMNLHEGALYGLSPAVNPLSLFGHDTPIRGLYLAGQTTYPGYGVGAATMSGVLAAERIAGA